jgi:urease accessory protein
MSQVVTNKVRRAAISLAALPFAMLLAAPASAHAVSDSAAGFATGFLHPLSGFDHLLAMVSVGIWGAELGAPAFWLLPIAFPLIMAFGGALGIVGVPLPGSELLVALSVVALGTLVVHGRKLPVAAALAIVGVFAIAHGHAHGAELPNAADALAFTIGFVSATGLLHLAGIGIGSFFRFPVGAVVIRACGLMIAVTGCYFVYTHAGA